MMHKHQSLSEFIKLVPENLEFPDPESTKDLTIESNASWTLGVKFINFLKQLKYGKTELD